MSHHIPDSWFRHACESAHIALALVTPDNKFVWCNHSFGSLLEYAVTELIGKTWLDVTQKEEVGGELEAIQDIVEGKLQYYTLRKTYVTKTGKKVPGVLTVFRFPVGSDALIGFTAEVLEVPSQQQFLEQTEEQLKEVDELKERIDRLESLFRSIHVVGTFLLKWVPLVGGILGAIYTLVNLFGK